VPVFNVQGSKQKIIERSNKKYGGAFSPEEAINTAHSDMARKHLDTTLNGYKSYYSILLNQDSNANERNALLRGESSGNASYM